MQRESIISKTDDRLHWVDVARGLAMLCVILGHMGFDNLNIFIYSFHMPLFFLLAGYFQKKQEPMLFIKKKTKSLLVPYLFTGIGLILATQLNNTAKIILHKNDALSASYLLIEWMKAICLGSGSRVDFMWIKSDIFVGATWFLLALFFAQVIVNLLIDKNKPGGGTILVVLIAIIGAVSARLIWLPLSIQAGAVAAIYVAAGYVYNMAGGTLSDLLKKKTVIISCSCVWILYLCVSYYFNNTLGLVAASYPLGVFDYIGSVAAVIVVLFISYCFLDKIPLVNTFLAWFGKNSLIVLCFHLIEMVALPFQSTIDFGLSIVKINIFGLSEILTFIVKVLWCCLAIWGINRSRVLRWIYNVASCKKR